MKNSRQYCIIILQGEIKNLIDLFSRHNDFIYINCLECPRPFIFEPTFFERESYIVQFMSGRKLIPFGQRKADNCSADTHLAWLGVKKLGTAFWIILQKMGLSVDSPYYFSNYLFKLIICLNVITRSNC